MPSPLLERYLRRRRLFEVGVFTLIMLGNAVANSVVATLELRRAGIAFAAWEPVTWEFSSHLVLLALMPALLAFDRRFPLYARQFVRNVPKHVAATLAFSALHIGGMVAVRELVYRLQGRDYDFGDWQAGVFYEYIIDARVYFALLVAVYLYRHVLLRLRGEASLLDPPEDVPAPRIERPERLLVRKFGKEFLVAVADIEWIESAENYVNLHVRGHVYPLRSTMADVLERIAEAGFARVHRRYIVNLGQVASMEPLDTGDAWIHLRDGTRLPCSRRHRVALKAAVA